MGRCAPWLLATEPRQLSGAGKQVSLKGALTRCQGNVVRLPDGNAPPPGPPRGEQDAPRMILFPVDRPAPALSHMGSV